MTPSLTAHRGGGRLGPENSLTGVRRAVAMGIPWAEVDVQLSADGAVVLFHDEEVEGISGLKRPVSQCTLEELRRPTPRREPVPTLEECIAVVRGRMQLNIELKDYGRSDALPERVVSVLRTKDFVPGARVSSFSAKLIRAVREVEPRLATGYVVDSLRDLSQMIGVIDFVSANHAAITSSMVRNAHHHGLEVHAWTVNGHSEMLRLLAFGVDNLITDDPTLGKEAIAEFSRKGWLARRLLRWKK